MRFLIALLLGITTGAAAAIGFLYYNPITSQVALSPLSVSDQSQFSLNYSAVADHAIVYTNNGQSRMHPHPAKVMQLWEAPIRQSEALVTLLRDARNQPAGFGIKFSSRSERTRVLNGEALVDSVWYVFLPDQGTMLIAQSENYWNFLRDIVVPAHWGAGNGWRGSWHGTITNGPGALGTARVYGGSGAFVGLESEAIESLTAKAYSVELGPVAMDGQLTIELPRQDVELENSTANSVSP